MKTKTKPTPKQRQLRQIVNALLNEIDRVISSVGEVERLKKQLENESDREAA